MKILFITCLDLMAQIDISPLPRVTADGNRLQLLFNIMLTIMGAVALLITTLAGFRYMTSRGNPQDTAKAKNAILYALAGLIVIMMAFVIVNFVLTRVG